MYNWNTLSLSLQTPWLSINQCYSHLDLTYAVIMLQLEFTLANILTIRRTTSPLVTDCISNVSSQNSNHLELFLFPSLYIFFITDHIYCNFRQQFLRII